MASDDAVFDLPESLTINKFLVEDKKIKPREKGLLLVLLFMKEYAQEQSHGEKRLYINFDQLTEFFDCGDQSLRSTLFRLMIAGYVYQGQEKEKGKYARGYLLVSQYPDFKKR